jgi:hypothetical protein
MKKSKILILFAFLLGSTLVGREAVAQPGLSVSFQTFYNELSPYGRWISHPQYGSIWSPYVDRDFQPYATNGQWMMTEYGNTWVSDYDWGWAPFHYGRWFFDDFYGWAWVPDYEWGPAWVDWRSGNGYYGWAPLWPGVRVGVSFNIPVNFWVFVPQRYIYRPRIFGFCVPRTRIVNVYNRTTIINNYYQNDNRVYSYGPRRSEIERATRSSVPVYRADELRGTRYASSRQNADGTYRADGISDSGLYRRDRNESGLSNRSSRQADATDGARSNRSYEATPSNRSRGSYESGIEENSRSNRSYESTAPSSRQRAYESAEPSGRYSQPESRPSVESPSSRSGSYESGNSSRSGRYSQPESRPSFESSPSRSRSYEPRSNSTPRSSEYNSNSSRSRSSAEMRSSSPAPRMRTEAPAARSSRGAERSTAAPRSSGSSSSESPASNRSRGPR